MVQVNDPAGTPPAQRPDGARTAEVSPPGERARRKGRFGAVLASLTDDPVGRTGSELTTGAVLGGWFRPESTRPPVSAARPGAAPSAADRVLLGARGDVAEARIRIGTGPLAGTELSVSAGPGARLVEAALLTCSAGSRQTLSLAMEEIRARLRAKGIVLTTGPSSQAGSRGRGFPSDDETGALPPGGAPAGP